ncbi:hypothetical protein HDV03_003251 [Kappamyces sp. JEL0829]|nr:hypothetical protein HDV03_003251 [Kappamyces sp. JEL0829]
MVIMDAFGLPVEGTETRVSAQNEGYEYMSLYMDQAEKVGKLENVIGWYHSHPGYGCWLSGIDVGTQKLNQQYSEPFLAIVVDPKRTIASGKVEIGAFRTYPEGHKPSGASSSDYQTIPLEKIEDFAHANSYYPLEVEYFKSSLDTQLLELLWKRYWINTLSSSPLLSNWGYITGQATDLAKKMENAEPKMGSYFPTGKSDFSATQLDSHGTKKDHKKEGPLTRLVSDAVNISDEATHGLLGQVVKDLIFNRKPL